MTVCTPDKDNKTYKYLQDDSLRLFIMKFMMGVFPSYGRVQFIKTLFGVCSYRVTFVIVGLAGRSRTLAKRNKSESLFEGFF